MAKLLGEVLLQAGIIGESQLQEALDAQLVYGGHLGTCLLELGYIDEEQLGQVLAETFGVKYVAPELLRNIPNEIIDFFSRSLVEKYQAIPFGRTEKGIHVAMINPRNLVALDEISFVSSHRSIPWVSPELRVLQAMERYYGTTRKLRYVTIF
ncbi:MAG: general secretion pathway protein GspE, partial [Acidobacteria bacterium]|nr:general secretion pathway protein GspE [Acidobacteriota bacterium]